MCTLIDAAVLQHCEASYNNNNYNIQCTLSLVMLGDAPASIRILMTSVCPFSDADMRAVHEYCIYACVMLIKSIRC